MLPQLEGANESKCTTPRPRLHQRMASLLCAKKSDTSSDDIILDEGEVDNTSPMRALSPRATEYTPSSPQKKKKYASSVQKRQSQSPRPASTVDSTSGTSGDKKEREVTMETRTGSGTAGGHGPGEFGPGTEATSEALVGEQAQPGRDKAVTSVGTLDIPESLTTDAALTSHPARSGESDSSDGKFETPMEENKKDGCLVEN